MCVCYIVIGNVTVNAYNQPLDNPVAVSPLCIMSQMMLVMPRIVE